MKRKTQSRGLPYLKESKSEAKLVVISRDAISAKIDLGSFGYSVAKTL